VLVRLIGFVFVVRLSAAAVVRPTMRPLATARTVGIDNDVEDGPERATSEQRKAE
jgi:hypothetical protein